MNRRLTALALALAVLAVLLSGCVTLPRYEWYPSGRAPSDYYRWTVIDRASFPLVCGFIPPDGFNGGGACAIQLNQGIVQPGDKTLNGQSEYSGPRFEGKLCVIFGTMSESDAGRMSAMDRDGSLRSHELRHCYGFLHNWINGRIG